jgi:short-chain fatty acids transporter
MTEQPGPVARAALALTDWTERWVPDAFIFALIATILVLIAALTATSATVAQTIDAWGRGFWDLIPFTLQMALVIITGHVLATSPPMGRLIRAVAAWPRSPRAAVLVAFFALASSYSIGASAWCSAPCSRSRSLGVAALSRWRGEQLGHRRIWAYRLSGSGGAADGDAGRALPQIRDIARTVESSPALILFRHTIFLVKRRCRRRNRGCGPGDTCHRRWAGKTAKIWH